MTATAFLIAAACLGYARAAVVELSCSDNATCIENLANEFVRSVRQQKTVRLFDVMTVEPLGTRQARSNEGLLERILRNNAFSLDWNDFTFRIWKDQNKDALDLEIYESRSAKDVSEEVPKKSKSKVEEEEEDVDDKKSPKGIRRRRAKKKIVQAVIPFFFGMKTSAAVIMVMALVTALTMKAFVASKVALIVTLGMAIKKLYESYSLGAGLQNHPYLYSQYPIDFPSASSHAYSVSGMSPQFPEMYNPTALGTHQQPELLPQDASAQQSQQAPTVQLINSTRASERWDGKSKLLKLIEPIVEGIRSYIDPITNMFYSMPATFRGLNSDVTTTKVEVEEEVKKPREFLIPQPRNIAQRKMTYRKAQFRSRPKKYTELNVDLDKLKKNKDLYDYVKTKKYKHNYQNTYYYPRVKYFVNPNTFVVKPKNNRLVPYKKGINNLAISNKTNATVLPLTEWKPIVLVPVITQNKSTTFNASQSFSNKVQETDTKRLVRAKRSIDFGSLGLSSDDDKNTSNDTSLLFSLSGRGFLNFVQKIIDEDPVSAMMEAAGKYTKSALKHSLKSSTPPYYYTMTYDLVMMCIDVIDGMVQVHNALADYFIPSKIKKKPHSAQKQKKKKKPIKQQSLSQLPAESQNSAESQNLNQNLADENVKKNRKM